MALPPLFEERLRTIVPPARRDAVLDSFASPQAVGFRVNTLKAEPDRVLAQLTDAGVEFTPVQGIPGAFSAPAAQRPTLLSSLAYAEGLLYVQNISSQLPAHVLGVKPDERVLDLCAAPGSKTRQLACLMQDEGEIVALEKVRNRFYKLRANLSAQGATCVLPVLGSGTAYWHREPELFDRVLVDAPCSTEGRFRAHDPETTHYWSLRKIKEMQAKQRKLLFGGLQTLKPGGTLVYSTCTFAPEENEAVLDKALRTFGDAVEVVPIPMMEDGVVSKATQPPLTEWEGRTFDARVGNARRVLPDGLLEGFFVACLVKHESTLR